MKTSFTFFILTLLSLTTNGQYPFEKYPAIKSTAFFNWITIDNSEKEKSIYFTSTITGIYKNHDTLKIQLVSLADNWDSSYIRLYRSNYQIQKFIDPFGLGSINVPDTIFVADFNGDGLMDIKILIPNNGCGAFNYYTRVIYLLQRHDGSFIKISFTDLFEEFVYRKERDIDGDGKYEIITQTFKNFDKHNYWLFNIYSFNIYKLTNVNYKDNYPIMVQLLYRQNYKITDKISRDKMKTFAKKLPDDYDEK